MQDWSQCANEFDEGNVVVCPLTLHSGLKMKIEHGYAMSWLQCNVHIIDKVDGCMINEKD